MFYTGVYLQGFTTVFKKCFLPEVGGVLLSLKA